MNVAYIGSCLSAQIVQSFLGLHADAALVDGLPHMRLDALHRLWVTETGTFPRNEQLKRILQNLEAIGQTNRNPNRLRSQTAEFLAKFRKNLAKTDCLIVDTNYDLSSSLYNVTVDSETCQLVNLQLRGDESSWKDSGLTNTGLMDLASANRIYQELFDHIASINPGIRIVLVQFPTSGFTDQAKSKSRILRAQQLAAEIKLNRVDVVPLIEIDSLNLSEKGAFYFSDRVYDAYARLISRLMKGESCPLLSKQTIELDELEAWIEPSTAKSSASKTVLSPYEGLPERNFWKPAVAEKYPLAISGLYDKKFPIQTDDLVATCGSCFAQHIGHRLKARGFGYLDVEPAPAGMSNTDRLKHGYGIYSARYGNVYTSTQLLQLFQQAFGEKSFTEAWESDRRFFDPFRPNIFPDGFATPEEMQSHRNEHLAKVKSLFEQLDVFIFTMGLTECWYNADSSAAYPTCPGVTVGTFDESVHKFRNLSFSEVMEDMLGFIERLRTVNPKARLLLTVSPVPLTATAEDRHVLVSTMHSKSTLRAVAGELAARLPMVDYFPSYEVIMSPPFRSMFFKNNLRNIHDEGVDFVMSHFFAQHAAVVRTPQDTNGEADEAGGDFCDEVFLELAQRMTA